MENAVIILSMAGVFVFGYFVLDSLDSFLDTGSKRRPHRRKKKVPGHSLLFLESFFR